MRSKYLPWAVGAIALAAVGFTGSGGRIAGVPCETLSPNLSYAPRIRINVSRG